MQPIDTEVRRVLAADRLERLRGAAAPPARTPGSARIRLGRLLIAAGLRFAPDALPQRRSVSRAAAAPSCRHPARAARPG
jgi:hypothetical protein